MQCILCGMYMNTFVDRFGHEYQCCPGCGCETQHVASTEVYCYHEPDTGKETAGQND